MSKDFNKEELEIINKLRDFKEGISPSKGSFERMLSSLQGDIDKDIVTNYDKYRYTFSMWKYALVTLVIALIGGLTFLKHGQGNQTSQTVTANNADSTLQETDSAISQASDQADQELNELDQTTSSEDDLNNI